MNKEQFDGWMAALEARHLAERTFPEVSRALRALSSAYVERRSRLAAGAALSGSGKRAAFALFYGPLHFLLVRHIAGSLAAAPQIRGPVTDLGCGTGAAGAAWASACAAVPALVGIDRNPWAAAEARHTYRTLGLSGEARVGDVSRVELFGRGAVIAAFTLNELAAPARGAMLPRLLAHAAR